ncbi:MAG: CDP-diacylglycerol---glycerol-3-phosphate 3-phosphatidyltransferase, partial [Cryptosporangiaceae bacterium]|nr:CDP-diacylglycerol---glycerol-3-phosphate 3-phosphatidyltransferase [Cryptosporangiaceae bacterium]
MNVPGFGEYLRLWSGGHGGYDPAGSVLVRGWLRGVYAVAAPLARLRVHPGALTAAGVLVCALVPGIAVGGSGWPLLAGLAAVASGLLDGLDGAVAMLSGRVTRFGAVLDGVADRAGETGYLLALWLTGAPAWLCLVGGVAAGLLEYARARAGSEGLTGIGVVTVFERPTRIAVTAAALVVAALAYWLVPSLVGAVATAGAAAWAIL